MARGRTAVFALIVAALLLAGLGLVAGYPIVRVRRAHTRIVAYCDGVTVGSPAALAELAADAQRKGYRVIGPTQDRSAATPSPAASGSPGKLKLMVVDGFVFARWICSITTDSGVVIDKSVSSLD